MSKQKKRATEWPVKKTRISVARNKPSVVAGPGAERMGGMSYEGAKAEEPSGWDKNNSEG